jgi:hypothetical protein
MPKKMTLHRIRKELDARNRKIQKEYDRRIKELETKIWRQKKEGNAKLIKSEKQFRKDFCITVKWIVGEEDYDWLNQWLLKQKEKEINETEKKHETKLANKLKKLSAEDYLFYYFNQPKIEERLKKEMEQNKSEEGKRLSLILAKLEWENLRLVRTRI